MNDPNKKPSLEGKLGKIKKNQVRPVSRQSDKTFNPNTDRGLLDSARGGNFMNTPHSDFTEVEGAGKNNGDIQKYIE